MARMKQGVCDDSPRITQQSCHSFDYDIHDCLPKIRRAPVVQNLKLPLALVLRISDLHEHCD